MAIRDAVARSQTVIRGAAAAAIIAGAVFYPSTTLTNCGKVNVGSIRWPQPQMSLLGQAPDMCKQPEGLTHVGPFGLLQL